MMLFSLQVFLRVVQILLINKSTPKRFLERNPIWKVSLVKMAWIPDRAEMRQVGGAESSE